MIRPCRNDETESIWAIINQAAQAYQDVIPADCWHEPYMTQDELRREIAAGVAFWGYEDEGRLVGVMGIQPVREVILIRHAYMLPAFQRQGIGGSLLAALRDGVDRPVLIGTWAAAVWAIAFYQKHGFRLVSPQEKEQLLRLYWSIPERQIETSVVLTDEDWFRERLPDG